jgi:transposase-like protein
MVIIMEFDVEKEKRKLVNQTKIIRKKRYYKSRLDLHKGELVKLHNSGLKISELQRWLKEKRIKVSWSTVNRWVKKHG